MKFQNIVLVLLFTIFISTIVWLAGSSPESSAASKDEINRYCQRSQNYLRTTMRQRDLRTRVDRLQTYRHIASRLDIFTKRLEQHSQPRAQTMRSLTTQFTRQVDDFKFKYEAYDKARDELADLSNCEQNISEFNNRLSTARSQLKAVSKSIKSIDSLLAIDIPGDLRVLKMNLEAVED